MTKDKRREETSIFLTEGDSAGGPMIQARDVYTQAIFSLKGKPLNVFGLKRDTVYKNEELYNIMRALGIEDGLDGLRYNKVIHRHGRGRGRHAHPQPAAHLSSCTTSSSSSSRATSTSWRRRCSGCAPRTRRCTATARRSGTRP